ncbi:MAG: HAMP domain-containing protein, partial [Deltaproteobacteria bacterium]|nr:HAMP domain-containing protein [Deltaproteobacteria bacterium]
TRMVAWMLVALLGALVLGVLSSRALVQPLERLAVGARQIKDGNIEHRVEGEDRTDELGDLARAFNRMAEEVERWRNELEDKVELRTRELKESQELLARAQKMAAVGQLGAGVAHEINNPLFALAGMAELLQADEEEGSKRHGKLGMIRKQAERIEVIVARLLAMADAAEGGQLHEHDVRESLGTAVERARELTGDSDIELKLEIDQVLPVRASSAELQEVFFAVLENAFDALGERGTIQVTVSVVDGQMVRVRIEDDGPGIARDLQHRIFDPFFTKSAKRGAKGLGLSTAQQIVSAHDGKILLESEEGKGTMVAVLLPVAQKRARR